MDLWFFIYCHFVFNAQTKEYWIIKSTRFFVLCSVLQSFCVYERVSENTIFNANRYYYLYKQWHFRWNLVLFVQVFAFDVFFFDFFRFTWFIWMDDGVFLPSIQTHKFPAIDTQINTNFCFAEYILLFFRPLSTHYFITTFGIFNMFELKKGFFSIAIDIFFYGSITFFHSIIHRMSIYTILDTPATILVWESGDSFLFDNRKWIISLIHIEISAHFSGKHEKVIVYVIVVVALYGVSSNKIVSIGSGRERESGGNKIHMATVRKMRPFVYPLNIYDFQDYFLFNLIASG